MTKMKKAYVLLVAGVILAASLACVDTGGGDKGKPTATPEGELTTAATPEPTEESGGGIGDYFDGTEDGGDPLNPEGKDPRVGHKVNTCYKDCTCELVRENKTTGKKLYIVKSCP